VKRQVENPFQQLFEEQVMSIWPDIIIGEYLSIIKPGEMILEFSFCLEKNWLFDAAIWGSAQLPLVAIEFHGGKYIRRANGSLGGAHHSSEGRHRDMVKLREASLRGIVCAEFEWNEVGSGVVYSWLDRFVRTQQPSGMNYWDGLPKGDNK
jgi:hypothetical protein